MDKPRVIPAINVLLAYAELRDCDQKIFNSKLNEFVFASPARKREFVERWQRVLSTAHRGADAND
jgi:hypothetical protein